MSGIRCSCPVDLQSLRLGWNRGSEAWDDLHDKSKRVFFIGPEKQCVNEFPMVQILADWDVRLDLELGANYTSRMAMGKKLWEIVEPINTTRWRVINP